MIVLSGFPGQFLNSFGLSVVCESYKIANEVPTGITFAVRLAKQDASYKGVLVGVCRVEVHAHRVTEQLCCYSRMN